MAKKIYDVVPPAVAKKAKASAKKPASGEVKIQTKKTSSPSGAKRGRKPAMPKVSVPMENFEPVMKEEKMPELPEIKETRDFQQVEKPRFVFPWKISVATGGVFVVLLAAFLFFTLGKADIQIWPKVDNQSYKESISVEKSATAVDFEKGVIPSKYFEEAKTETADFPATGNANNEGKATGIITVYNSASPASPVTLKAGTHFLSNGGKYFVTLQKIIVPAGKKSGAKILPGTIDVKVEAAEGGVSYNIAASDFSVPKLSGTALYYTIYAKSSQSMTGGFDGKSKKVTDDDLQTAKDVMVKKATASATDALKAKLPQDYVLVGDIDTEIGDNAGSLKVGSVAEKFSYSATVAASALAVKKDDLGNFAKKYIISKAGESRQILDKTFSLKFTPEKVDVSGGKAVLDLDFSAGTYENIEPGSLVQDLMGKTGSQIDQTITDKYGDNISKVNVKFSPFWVTSAPKKQKAVKVELMFE